MVDADEIVRSRDIARKSFDVGLNIRVRGGGFGHEFAAAEGRKVLGSLTNEHKDVAHLKILWDHRHTHSHRTTLPAGAILWASCEQYNGLLTGRTVAPV